MGDLIAGIDYIGIAIASWCHDGKGNIALNLRGENCRGERSRWDLVSGELEKYETFEKAMKREIKQEYTNGKDIVLEYKFLGVRQLFRKDDEGQPTHWLGIDYKVLVDREKVLNGEPHKFDAVEWFAFNNLPSPLHSQFPEFLRKYSHLLI